MQGGEELVGENLNAKLRQIENVLNTSPMEELSCSSLLVHKWSCPSLLPVDYPDELMGLP